VKIEDQGVGPRRQTPEIPDLEAKLAGLQSPRGWGLFLISSMVDELIVTTGDGFHRLELIFNLIKKRS
jgi:anti-sigma regulatory factor (Ser/Thr protein kinase)